MNAIDFGVLIFFCYNMILKKRGVILKKIIDLRDKMNYGFYFNKYWNSFVNSKTPKLHYSLEEFLDKMNDDKFMRMAINKMEYQDRIISCQYLKEDSEVHGFGNFFLMFADPEENKCCSSKYLFIYKHSIDMVKEKQKDVVFLPKRKFYKKLQIHPDSFEYLANFSVPLEENDYIYCPKCKELYHYSDFLEERNVVKL